MNRGERRWFAVRWLCVMFVLGGCIVTKPLAHEKRPRWYTLGPAALDADCLIARAFVRKSGKQGVGLALQLRSRRDCSVSIDTVRIAFAKREIIVPSIAPLALRGRSQLYAWLPVPFDNNAAWNAERNQATLELALTVDGKPVGWKIPMEQRADLTPDPPRGRRR
jgi:hypothetical protein